MKDLTMVECEGWETTAIFRTVLIILAVTLLSRKFLLHVYHPLYMFPGPRLAAWSNLWYSVSFLRGHQPYDLVKLHEKYGPVVRISPNELSFNTANSWNDIYGIRQGHATFRKGSFYEGGSFHEEVRSIVTETDPKKHAHMRKLLSNAFSERALRDQEKLIAEIIDEFIQQLGVHGESPEGTDLQWWLNMTTFEITGSLAFGQRFDALKNGKKHPSIVFIQKALKQLVVLDTMKRFPWIGATVKILFRGRIADLMYENEMHEKCCLEAVEKRLKEPSDRKDFIFAMLNREGDQDISNVQLAAHVADLLQAGVDTSNTTICTAFYYLLLNAEHMKAAVAEVRGRFSDYEAINAISTQSLSYCKAVCLEAMRIFPPLPLGLPRVIPEGGDTVDGYFVAAGTVVSTNPMAASLSSRNFESSWEFRPERWLSQNETDDLSASQPFSVGPRRCIGQNLAWIEMNTIMAKMLFTYDFELASTELDWHRDSWMGTMWVKPEFLVRVNKRKLS